MTLSNATFTVADQVWRRLLSDQALAGPEEAASTLAGIEQEHGVQLAPAYREIAAAVQGCVPERCLFACWDVSLYAAKDVMDGQLRSLDMFLLLNKGTPPAAGLRTVEFQSALIRDAAPGLIPIALDGRGNLVCLDFDDDWQAREPSVSYFDRGRLPGDNVFPVSPSFDDFLRSLMALDEDTQNSFSLED